VLLFTAYSIASRFNLSIKYIFLGLLLFAAIKLASDYQISNHTISITANSSDKDETFGIGITMHEAYALINEAYQIFISKAASKGIGLKLDDILNYLKSNKSDHSRHTKEILISALHCLNKSDHLFFDGDNVSISKDAHLSIASRYIYDACMQTGRYSLDHNINLIKKKNNIIFIDKLHYLATRKSHIESHIVVPIFEADKIRFANTMSSFRRTGTLLSFLAENKVIEVIWC
jgi:hypothetical protein